MVVLTRALIYAAIFIGVVLIFVPASLLSSSGNSRPEAIGTRQIVGIIMSVLGLALALWCVLIFAIVGKGTPAPFDPPRRLVVRGPYRVVRNPMYLGAGLALVGAAVFYDSSALWWFVGGFLLVVYLFILGYEEPILRQSFGEEYEEYTKRVGRFLPRL